MGTLRRRITGLAGLVTLLAGAGCGAGDGLGLFQHATLRLHFDQPKVSVTLFGEPRNGRCPVAADDLSGTVNGAPLRVVSRGGELPPEGFSGPRCYGVELEMDPAASFAPGGTITVRLRDSDGRIEADFANVLAQRTMRVVEPPEQPVYVGQRVVLRLSPPDPALWSFDGQRIVYGTATNVIGPAFTAAVQIVDDTIVFEVPGVSYAPSLDPIVYSISANVLTVPPVLRCEGVATCLLIGGTPPGRTTLTVINRDPSDTSVCYRCECICPTGDGLSRSSAMGPIRCVAGTTCVCPARGMLACTATEPVPS
jgi:hypothetical protein